MFHTARSVIASAVAPALVVVAVAAVSSTARGEGCPAPDNNDPTSTAWTNKLIAAITEEPACTQYRPQAISPFNRHACNIFVGRVLERIYGVKDFIVDPPNPN